MRQKASFFGPISSKITLTKERTGEKEEARRKKGGEEKPKKKPMLHSYSFYMKLLDGKGPFASNAFKNPARYKYLYKLTMFVWGWMEMIPN